MKAGALAAFAMAAAVVLSLSAAGQPTEQKGGKSGKGGFPGGPGGFGMRPQPGQILPSFIQDRLKLTDDQKKQVADLQKDVDSKIDKLLTDEQRAEFKKIKEQGPGFGGGPGGGGRGKGGFGGGKGFPGGGKGGPGPGPKE
jgi:Spy/CpxP family protein refolding chaperone